jgi:hypothetical protein
MRSDESKNAATRALPGAHHVRPSRDASHGFFALNARAIDAGSSGMKAGSFAYTRLGSSTKPSAVPSRASFSAIAIMGRASR